jgi:uncharacterized protein (TIGR02996 family)
MLEADLADLRQGPFDAWAARLARLVAASHGPSLSIPFAALVAAPPYQATSSQEAWVLVFRELLRADDPRALDPLRPLAGRYAAHIGAATMGAWMDAQVATVLAWVDPPSSAPPVAGALARAKRDAERMEILLAMLRAPANPPIAREVEAFLASPTARTPAQKPLWLRLAAVSLRHADAELAQAWRARGAGDEHQQWLLAELDARVPQRAPQPRAPTAGEALLDAIRERPDDDAPRAAYAEHLRAAGDPRGDFVDLQLRAAKGPLSPADARREAALLKKHGRAWLGPLAPIVVRDRSRFTRGFPSHLFIFAGDPSEMRALAGNPAWATVEALEFTHRNRCCPQLSAQDGVGHPVFRALRDVSGLDAEHLLEACAAHGPRLQAVAVFNPPDAARDVVLEALRALAHLSRLRVGNGGHRWSGAFARALLDLATDKRLALFSSTDCHGHEEELAPWVDHLRGTGLPRVELRADACGVWEHGGLSMELATQGGALSETMRVLVTPHPEKDRARGTRAAFSGLPSHAMRFKAVGIRRVEVFVPAGFDGPAHVEAIISRWARRPVLPEMVFTTRSPETPA